MVDRLTSFIEGRTCNAEALHQGLRTVQGVHTVTPGSGSASAYLRYPILVGDSRGRDKVVDDLVLAGIGASCSYPESLVDIPALRNILANPKAVATGGRYVARHIVTLPTHSYVTAADIGRIVAIVAGEPVKASVAIPTPV
jgi:dTDP-4-amino-4,6-dideoxygalactose transaminase